VDRYFLALVGSFLGLSFHNSFPFCSAARGTYTLDDLVRKMLHDINFCGFICLAELIKEQQRFLLEKEC